jgi:hypothetical protein
MQEDGCAPLAITLANFETGTRFSQQRDDLAQYRFYLGEIGQIVLVAHNDVTIGIDITSGGLLGHKRIPIIASICPF